MRRLLVFLAAAGCLAATTIGCGRHCRCNPRHGFLLRGDWSLELNRVPWRGAAGAAPVCAEGCCEQPPLMVPGAVDEVACVGPTSCEVCSECVPGGCEGCLGGQGQAEHAVVTAPPRPRFHPVPTRPVFRPWSCPQEEHASRPQPIPDPLPAQPEVIPTPAAGGELSVGETEPQHTASRVSWVF